MNERIRELAEQAKEESNQWLGSKPATTITYDELKKFAELIVKECIEWCNAHATINGTAQQVRDSIKEHFGVEE